MLASFWLYPTIIALSSFQCLVIGAIIGISSTLILNLWFNSVSHQAHPPPGFEAITKETMEQKNKLQSTEENLLASTHTTHQHLYQHLVGMDKAFDEYTHIRQELFQSLRERQALEKNVTSILALFESEESQLVKTIHDFNHIKVHHLHEIALLQNSLQNLLQCLEEKDMIIESLKTQQAKI